MKLTYTSNFAYNTSEQASTKKFIFEILYGTEPNFLHDIPHVNVAKVAVTRIEH